MEETDGPEGIAGWLIPMAIGLVTSPLLMLGALGENISLLDGGNIEALEVSYPGFELAVHGQTLLQILLFVFLIITVFAFYRKKNYLPRLMIALLAFNLFVTFVVVAWTSAVVGSSPQGASELTRSAAVAVVWIPYFLRSRRVRNTFVR